MGHKRILGTPVSITRSLEEIHDSHGVLFLGWGAKNPLLIGGIRVSGKCRGF